MRWLSSSQELAYLGNDADLVILEGMGHGIETNLYAQFKCDSPKIGMAIVSDAIRITFSYHPVPLSTVSRRTAIQ
ncbi:hypothetical protein GOBAR_DD25449 [Gossypium barbadense]|nr:hypothetical protein GOBAR_DD25449 [Gossypium barbadense]